MENREAARLVFGIAALLESQGANPFRVRAYRRAAVGLMRLPDRASQHTTEQRELALPWLGPSLRRKLGELVTDGRMTFHEQLLADLPPRYRELLSVPGVGPKTAQRLIDGLDVRGLGDLIEAARAKRLQQLRGIGPAREQQLGLAAESLLGNLERKRAS